MGRRGAIAPSDTHVRSRLIVFFSVLSLTSCNSNPASTTVPAVSRIYHGAASVGDFMTLTVNATDQTISYDDLSNNTRGTVPYTLNSGGTYTLKDPTGNLLAAYELPNYALLLQAAKTGPNADTPALVMAVDSAFISMSTFEEQSYNYIQFRTRAGGVEVGSVSIGTQGTGSITSFWPYAAYHQSNQGGTSFGTGTLDMSSAQLDPSGTFLKIPDPGNNGTYDYVFGTASGIFAVDTPNGAILGFREAGGAVFDPTVAGAYKSIYYQKTKASTSSVNLENGTSAFGDATLLVSNAGVISMTDAHGTEIVRGRLSPVLGTSYLYKPDMTELQDPCYGLFTFRIATPGVSQQDVFVTFIGQAMLFASFTENLVQQGSYSYFYGVALK